MNELRIELVNTRDLVIERDEQIQDLLKKKDAINNKITEVREQFEEREN